VDDEALRDLFGGIGRITIKRMFGGKGIYHDGLIIALIVSGDLLLKADAESAPDFEEAGSKQWIYEGGMRKGRVAMPYWSVPDTAIDDPDEMTAWARKAYQASLRSQKPKKRATRSKAARS
jgi:DNA transformation protein